MINQLKQTNRFNISVLLLTMCVFSFGLSVFRFMVTDSPLFLFLNWNLFLAFIPWCISTLMIIKGANKNISVALLIASWLLFFPNAPYILTDLFHLQYRSNKQTIWFDLIEILSFAWTGLLFGLISLMDIEYLLQLRLKNKITSALTTLFLFMSGFGIYLGRYLRWNSWDIIKNPLGLFSDIVERFINPMHHPRTWGMTILMGILLNMMYYSLKILKAKTV
ncbi:MAG: hypothetical protein RI955_1652 [Bacteroidota bacterium]